MIDQHVAGPSNFSGTLTSGLTTVTGVTTTGLVAGEAVTGAGVPPGTTIQSINSVAGVITLSTESLLTGYETLGMGADFLVVQSLSGSGTFTLSTSLTPSSDPGQTAPANFQEGSIAPIIAVGDFTNNGILDIVAPDGVHLGTGDGTFEAPAAGAALVDPSLDETRPRSRSATSTAMATLTWPSLWPATDSISISLGNGDGTFQPASTIGLPVAGMPDAIVAGDFGQRHHRPGGRRRAQRAASRMMSSCSWATATARSRFCPAIAVGQGPVAIAEGDFENDGRIDLAVADTLPGDVTILSNQGGGNFVALPPSSCPRAPRRRPSWRATSAPATSTWP